MLSVSLNIVESLKVEQGVHKPLVAGSITAGTNFVINMFLRFLFYTAN